MPGCTERVLDRSGPASPLPGSARGHRRRGASRDGLAGRAAWPQCLARSVPGDQAGSSWLPGRRIEPRCPRRPAPAVPGCRGSRCEAARRTRPTPRRHSRRWEWRWRNQGRKRGCRRCAAPPYACRYRGSGRYSAGTVSAPISRGPATTAVLRRNPCPNRQEGRSPGLSCRRIRSWPPA